MLYTAAADKLAGVLENLSVDVSKQLEGISSLPVLPDLIVKRASMTAAPANFERMLSDSYPKWVEAFWKSADSVFDNDATVTKDIARHVVASNPGAMKTKLDEEASNDVCKALGAAALLDLYSKLRMQEEGKPSEVLQDIPGWAWGFGGFVLGVTLGTWLGVNAIDKFFDRQEDK